MPSCQNFLVGLVLVAATEMILTLPAVVPHQLVGTAVKLMGTTVKLMVAVLHHLAMLVAVVLHQLVVL